jgi:hypothetical protein
MSTPLCRTRSVGLAALLAGLLSTPSQPARAGVEKPPLEELPAVSALLQIDRHPPGVLEDGKQGAADPAELEEYRRTQMAALRSRLVLAAALRRPGIKELAVIKGQKDPLAWLEKRVRAEVPNHPTRLRVWVNGGSPQEQAALANAVVRAYLEEVVSGERKQRLQRLEQLKDLHDRYREQMRRQRKILHVLGERFVAEAAERDVQKQLLLQELKALQVERLQVRSELRRLRLQRAAVKDRAEAALPEAELEKILDKDEQLRMLRDRAADLEARLTALAQRIRSPSPTYAAEKTRLEETKKSLAARREQLRQAAAAQAQERQHGRLDDQIRLLEKLSDQLEKEIKERTRDYGRLVREARPPELEEVREEIREAEELVRKIGGRIRLLEVEIDARPRVYLLQEASAPK